MRRILRQLGPSFGLILSIALLQAAVAHAQSTTWVTTPTDNLWSTAANWTNGVPANAATADVHYSATTNAFVNPYVDNSQTIGDLEFDANANATAFTQSGDTLTIAGINGTGIINNSSATQIINNSIILGAAQNWNANAGNLTFGNSAATIDNNGFLLTLNGAATTTIDGQITGSGGLTKSNTGTTILANGTNNFTGPVTISAGTFQAGASGSLADVAYTITGGQLNNNGFTNTIASANLSNASSITGGTGGNLTVTGQLSVAGTSTVNVDGGNLTITGQLSVAGTSTVNVDGGTATVGALTGVSGTTLNLGSSGTFINNNGSDQTLAGSIQSSSDNSTFHLEGTGTLTLTGDNQSNFTGGKYIIDSSATLKVGAANSVSTAKYQVDGTLNANGKSFTTTGLTGASTGNVNLGAGTMTIQDMADASYDGAVTGTPGAAIVTSSSNTANQTINGVISGATSITANGGTLTLGNTPNTYTGNTTLNSGGTVSVAAAGALGASTSQLNFQGGTLKVTGTTFNNLDNQTFNNTTFDGGFDIDDASNTFTVNQALTVTGTLTKSGDGTLVLTNANNTFANTTQVTGGTLEGATSSLKGDFNVSNSATLDFNQSTTGTYSGVISGSVSNVTQDGTGTLIFTGNNTYMGTTTINGGTLQIGGTTTTAGTTGSLGTGNVVNNGSLVFNRSDDITVANNIVTTSSGVLTKNGAGTLTLNGTNTYAGATTLNAGRLDINVSTTSSTITVAAKVTGSTKITGGTLGGYGTIVGNIVNNNIVSPGTVSLPQAILNQTGNYTGNSGSSFVVSVNDDGSNSPTPGVTNSELNVIGAATLESGSKVMVNIEGNPVIGATYTLIHTTGGATVDSDVTFETNRYFVKAVLDETPTDIDVTLTEDFVHSGATYNKIQLGTYLNNNSSNTNPDFQKLLAALNSIPNDAAAQAAGNTNDIAASMQVQTNDVSTATLVGGGLASVPEPNAIVLLMMGLFPFWKVFAGKSKRQ